MDTGLILEGGRRITQGEMIEVLGDGDIEAFHFFCQDAAKPVYSSVLSLTRNPEEAKDVTQDTCLTTWTRAGSYVPQGKPLVQVFTITRNLYHIHLREQKMKTDVALEDLAERERGEYHAPSEQTADREVLLDVLGRINCEE